MLSHINGHIMTKNENDDLPVLVFNPVNTSGIQTGVIGDYITANESHVNGLYRAKCIMMNKGIGDLGDTQNICMLADNGYMLVNAFCLYQNAEIAVDETAFIKTLRAVKFAFPNYVIRIPDKLGHKDMTSREWQPIFGIIMRELVNSGMTIEIWHRVD